MPIIACVTSSSSCHQPNFLNSCIAVWEQAMRESEPLVDTPKRARRVSRVQYTPLSMKDTDQHHNPFRAVAEYVGINVFTFFSSQFTLTAALWHAHLRDARQLSACTIRYSKRKQAINGAHSPGHYAAAAQTKNVNASVFSPKQHYLHERVPMQGVQSSVFLTRRTQST